MNEAAYNLGATGLRGWIYNWEASKAIEAATTKPELRSIKPK